MVDPMLGRANRQLCQICKQIEPASQAVTEEPTTQWPIGVWLDITSLPAQTIQSLLAPTRCDHCRLSSRLSRCKLRQRAVQGRATDTRPNKRMIEARRERLSSSFIRSSSASLRQSERISNQCASWALQTPQQCDRQAYRPINADLKHPQMSTSNSDPGITLQSFTKSRLSRGHCRLSSRPFRCKKATSSTRESH